MRIWSVPPVWKGQTAVLIASGPSLSSDQLAHVRAVHARGGCRVIAINNAWERAPWADALYACDPRWWEWYGAADRFHGIKVTLEQHDTEARVLRRWPEVKVLRNDGRTGLCEDPTALRTGKLGGYQAINLAAHLGAARLLLLGYDCRRGPNGELHCHPDHPIPGVEPKPAWRDDFATLIGPLQTRGIEVVNCTPGSALTCFPMGRVEDELGVAA